MSQKLSYHPGLLILLSLALFQEGLSVANDSFKTERDKVSYAFGMNIGRTWKDGQIDLNPEVVVQGLKDVLAGQGTMLTDAEMNSALAQFGRDLRLLQQRHREQTAEMNLRQGEAFLARNQTNHDVICLPGGLQYQVIAQGTGSSPDLTNWVKLKFRSMRINGTTFDSSDAHPEASVFSLRSVIQGWADALQRMKPGDKWRLYVPSGLAYGKEGSPDVGPNETLIFELELVSILPGLPQPTAEDLKNERGPDGD